MSLVTCIVPTYNNLEHLEDAIRSINCQTYSDIELIVVDDCSDEFSVAGTEKLIDFSRFKRVLVYGSEKNVGTVKNINRALRVSQGDIVMELAGDDMFADPSVVERVVDRFNKTSANVIACRRLLVSRNTLEPLELVPNSAQIKIAKSRCKPRRSYVDLATRAFMDRASGSATYYRRSFMVNRGLYDERFRLWEDGPLYAQMLRAGKQIEYAYDIVSVLYRDGGISGGSGRSETNSIPIDDDSRLFYELEYKPYFGLLTAAQRCSINLEHQLRCQNRDLSLLDIIKNPLAAPRAIMVRLVNRYARFAGKHSKDDAELIASLRVGLESK